MTLFLNRELAVWRCLPLLWVVFGFSVHAASAFSLNGRSVEVVTDTALRSPSAFEFEEPAVALRDQESGRIRYYGQTLVMTLHDESQLGGVLKDYPALRSRLAAGRVAYLDLPMDQIASIVEALSTDTRIQSLHFRPLNVPVQER
jgi:hypothetical protein